MPTNGTPDAEAAAEPDGSASAYALIVHVWHLDTLDDLAAAYGNFPAEADRFVTHADGLSEADRLLIADKLPGARLVPVRNEGQDVGALFQLMDRIDLGRYAFVCKIHSKKGGKMPDAWRRTLLGGVLGSREQADHAIRVFLEDRQVMLAGARQLFLYGPAYLWKNADAIRELCGPVLQGFDFHRQDWGFIAGTCFWIRTGILQRLRCLGIAFEAGTYADDGTLAHTLERMFGMMVAIEGGKVLLFDQRDGHDLPRPSTGFDEGLSRERLPIVRTLTDLEHENRRLRLRAAGGRRRLAVFAGSSEDGLLPPQVPLYLEGLRPLVERIVAVFDGDLEPGEADRLDRLADHVIAARRGERGFVSYGRGVAWAREAGHLDEIDDLILCDDSCFGPIGSFAPMFERMDARGLDFWGAADSLRIRPHLQGFFLVLGRQVVHAPVLGRFLDGIARQPFAYHVIPRHDLDLTTALAEAGFAWGAMAECRAAGPASADPTQADVAAPSLAAVAAGVPLIRADALRQTSFNQDEPSRVLDWLRTHAPAIHDAAVSDIAVARFEDAGRIAFSLVMPTHNRAWCIVDAIRSVLAQTHPNLELIVVDDGSTDGTADALDREFRDEMRAGRLRYVGLDANVGVCAARNIGIAHARHDWIAYADSDNQLRPDFLSIVANAIVENPQADCFYGQFLNLRTGLVVGRPFARASILAENHIDLGVFVHRRSLISRFGGFDPDLRRLVDLDLILRLTAHKEPVFIPRVLLDYADDDTGRSADRISVRESFLKARVAVHSKHSPRPTVSTLIVSHNHQRFIVEAIESALEQRGDFTHEILLADDGSSDGTARIAARYAARHPGRIRNVGSIRNRGISQNYRDGFREAAGNFVAILEGDDYWIDPEKNARQADFLCSHPEAGMVFSRIELFDMATDSRRTLARQEGLPPLLTGEDFLRNEHLNLIVNLSSTMVRRGVLMDLPSAIYRPRLSEIVLAFHLDRLGPIGFIDRVMGVYRLNPSSVWTGADPAGRLEQAIATRLGALAVARPAHRRVILQRIREKRDQLAALGARRLHDQAV